MAGSGMPSHRSMVIKVSIFAAAMLLVSAGLVVVFGDFRFGPESTYHATFVDVSRLKAGQKVRIAGVPVGAVEAVKLNRDNTIDVTFGVDKRYTLYSSTRAVIRYENLVGDRYLEITSGPGELRKLPAGGTINSQHTQPALDLDALLGGLRPVLKGLTPTRSTPSAARSSSCCRARAARCPTCWPTPARSLRRWASAISSSVT